MKIRRNRFNIYLILLLLLMVSNGCNTTKEKGVNKKQLSSMRIHLEVNRDGTDRNEVVPVLRENPIAVSIEKVPFLNEAHIAGAKVIDEMGGFALRIQLNQQGTWLLDQYTTANKGRRLVIFGQFGEKLKEARWLGAPVIRQRITNGLLTFTPDASREEADEIALGLNNVAKKIQDKAPAW